MSIFKHSGSNVKEAPAPSPQTAAATAQAEQSGKLLPPFMPPGAAQRPAAAPGVVPPPAAPVYSMRPPEPAARADNAAAAAVSEDVRRARAMAAIAQAARAQRSIPAACPPAPPRHEFDRMAATQAGLLKLAWKWQEAGAPIRAIHTYIELLTRYPDTPGADAAVADLVELSDILTEQGQFHTALAIYDHLEELLA